MDNISTAYGSITPHIALWVIPMAQIGWTLIGRQANSGKFVSTAGDDAKTMAILKEMEAQFGKE